MDVLLAMCEGLPALAQVERHSRTQARRQLASPKCLFLYEKSGKPWKPLKDKSFCTGDGGVRCRCGTRMFQSVPALPPVHTPQAGEASQLKTGFGATSLNSSTLQTKNQRFVLLWGLSKRIFVASQPLPGSLSLRRMSRRHRQAAT